MPYFLHVQVKISIFIDDFHSQKSPKNDPVIFLTKNFHFINVILMLTFTTLPFTTDRVSVTSFCPMDLANFPFDVQLCKFYLEPCKYKSSLIHLSLLARRSTFDLTKATLPLR